MMLQTLNILRRIRDDASLGICPIVQRMMEEEGGMEPNSFGALRRDLLNFTIAYLEKRLVAKLHGFEYSKQKAFCLCNGAPATPAGYRTGNLRERMQIMKLSANYFADSLMFCREE